MKYYLFHERASLCRYRKALLVMKLSIILLVAFVLNAGAKGTAQTVSLSVKDMPLEKVCKEIERQTGFYFVYSKEMSKESHLVSLIVKSASLEETLKQLFEGLPFKYELIDKVVVVNTVNKAPDLPKSTEALGDQGITIEGVVLSDQGQPLAGASVMVKKTGRTTFTDSKGKFLLKDVPENSVLVITNVGFAPKQVSVHNGSVRIQLEIATNDLDAMVIKGYYTTSNRLNTGNAVTVKGEDIRKQPVTDPIQALEGRVAGLNIQQYSGVPGAYATVQIRGRNSIASGLDPLYIIDGVPYNNSSLTNAYIGGGAIGVPVNNRPNGTQQNDGSGLSPFNNIDPNEIESITVLKDADATAIYGSRGANGVILITTRKGKSGQTKVDVNFYCGGGKITRKLNLLNTGDYLRMRREAFRNDNAKPNPNIDFDLTYWDTTQYTDWQKIMIGNTSNFTNANANISGGNSNTQFLIGLGYSDQGTVYPGKYHDQKSSAHLSISNNSTNQRFHSEFSASYIYDINKLPLADFVGSVRLAPDAPAIYKPDGSINWAIRNGGVTFANPLAATSNRANALTDNLVCNLGVGYLILNGLKIGASLGYTHAELNQANLTFASSAAPPNDNNPGFRSNSFSTSTNSGWVIEPQINYTTTIFKGVLEATVGGTFQASTSRSIGQNASGFVSDALVQNPVGATSLVLVNYNLSQYRYNALYARIGYNYLNKYILNLTARRDGSSRFGPGKQFGNFGAIGAGWIFSNEDFFKENISFASFGKIRGSYGVTGNDQLSPYRYLDTYSPSANGIYQGVSGIYPTQLTNPYYAWERDKKLEGGLDIGFCKDRVVLSASYYRNRTDNQLLQYSLPFITGGSNVQANLPAVIQNSGAEFSLNVVVVRNMKFTWKTSGNISIPRNKLLSYPNIENSPYQNVYAVGKPLSVASLYHFIGVNPENGLYSFATKKGDNTPAFPTDRHFTKPITQDYYGGFLNSFTYQSLQLDLFIQFVKQRGRNYLASFGNRPPGSRNVNFPEKVLDRWKKSGDQTNVQRFSQASGNASRAYSIYYSSDAMISDASFIRFKNVSLSYTFPDKLLKKANLQSFRIYCQTQNLFTITKYLGMDPETQGFLPPMRMITCGVQLVM